MELFENGKIYKLHRQNAPSKTYPNGSTETAEALVIGTPTGQMHIRKISRVSNGKTEEIFDVLNFVGQDDLHWYNDYGDSFFITRKSTSDDPHKVVFDGRGSLQRHNNTSDVDITWIGEKSANGRDIIGHTFADGQLVSSATYKLLSKELDCSDLHDIFNCKTSKNTYIYILICFAIIILLSFIYLSMSQTLRFLKLYFTLVFVKYLNIKIVDVNVETRASYKVV